MNRLERLNLSQETLAILESGVYRDLAGKVVSIKHDLAKAISGSIMYKPQDDITLENIRGVQTKIEVTSETTLEAAERLIVKEGLTDVVCLNFASAKNPGGGFLNGSQAQEESLARSSGLYPCILQMTEMYNYNKSLRTALYSDYMIYSPNVPVFRDDPGKLIKVPYCVSFITAPSVNAGAVRENERQNINKIDTTMINRIRKILQVASKNGQKSLILGAFGCGVFKNNPSDVVGYFKKVLTEEEFKSEFNRVTFAIYDNSIDSRLIKTFRSVLEKKAK